ncbi:DUF2254 domain-containing protein [Virgibacillus sp. 179-BFC.A HS]|uniref:DUF2254 domain-containing protein n=1 Tax=Tigheibacillus jepli TaxID=3035914 RepID=A0ABU5CKA9_9BACI|nr:DUF2254 domain-containing protein [Virgibacillus sp. 179-BFC.A HS]MDY0406791.1 DUF2254 domain-containing protein [Virgibacillus sp. 179-BFC.A HS]
MEREKIWIRIREAFWFLPGLYSIAAICLVLIINSLDSWILTSFQHQLPKMILTTSDIAKELYSALASAILNMTTISFSIIMVVLTTYSTQFSPRTLQDFMRSKTTHHVLGVYCFGFIFALLHLLLVGKSGGLIGPIVMVIISILVLAFFVYFIHLSSRWVQVNNLIATIRVDGSRVISHMYKERDFQVCETWDRQEIERATSNASQPVHAIKSGYVQTIDWKKLVEWAVYHDQFIQMNVQIGDFVIRDYPIMYVNAQQDEEFTHTNEYILIGNERTDLQDIEFSLQKLVEIALRAISPAINDPHTAINCINRIGELLSEIGKEYKEINYLADHNQQLRVIIEQKKYETYLYKSFYQIRHYGKDDVSVIYGIIEVLYKIAVVSNDTIKQKLWDFHIYILDVIDWESLSKLDYKHLQSITEKFRRTYQAPGLS